MTLHFLTLYIWTFTILWNREQQLELQNNNLQTRWLGFHQLQMSAMTSHKVHHSLLSE